MSTTFADLGVPTDLCKRLHSAGITAPFPVQAMTVADALAGRDLCGKAPTGSGKTLAFAIPLAALSKRAEPRRPRALVLVPTRELAAQVCDTLLPLAEQRQRRVATVYGGTSINRDQQRLRKGVDILVATPGRLADLVRRRDCHLDAVSLVVVDEADRMTDMGFLPEVKRLLDQTSPDRQTLLFSATLDGDVDELIRRYQSNPLRHVLPEAPGDRGDVQHMFWQAEREERRKLTGEIVRRVEAPAIVFTRTKHGADRLAKQLGMDGITTAAIHGNRSQGQRERALAQFRSGAVTTLVATDVAARGIHVDDIGVVIHYDLPGSDKDYVHRSGRTGRAGATGLVVSLVDRNQRTAATAIQRSLDMPQGLQRADLDLLARHRPTHPTATRSAAQHQPATRPNGTPAERGEHRDGTGTGAARNRAGGQPHRKRNRPSRGGQPTGNRSTTKTDRPARTDRNPSADRTARTDRQPQGAKPARARRQRPTGRGSQPRTNNGGGARTGRR